MVRVKNTPRHFKNSNGRTQGKKMWFLPTPNKLKKWFYHSLDPNMRVNACGQVFTRYIKNKKMGRVGRWRRLYRRKPKSYVSRSSSSNNSAIHTARRIQVPRAFVYKTRWKGCHGCVIKALFVLECYLGRTLDQGEQACHGVAGCLNDSIDNLYVSSQLSNAIDEWEHEKRPVPSANLLNRTIERIGMLIDGQTSWKDHLVKIDKLNSRHVPQIDSMKHHIVDWRDENMRVNATNGNIETKYVPRKRKEPIGNEWIPCNNYHQQLVNLPRAFTNQHFATNSVNKNRYVLSVYLGRRLSRYEDSAHILSRSCKGGESALNLYAATYVENIGVDEILCGRTIIPSREHLQECVDRLKALYDGLHC